LRFEDYSFDFEYAMRGTVKKEMKWARGEGDFFYVVYCVELAYLNQEN